MINSLSLLYYIKKSKADQNKKCNIYMRITIDGKRAEFSINRKIEANRWIAKSGVAKGSSPEINELNSYLVKVKTALLNKHQEFIVNEKALTAISLRDAYLGKSRNNKMLLKIFQEHNDKVNSLIGKDFSAGTAERYRTAKKHIENFIKNEYKLNDIPVTDVDYRFISGFEYYLKTVRKCSHNTAIKYITNFKKIIRIALANDWIKKDPFLNWKVRLKNVEREFLLKKNLRTPRLEQVRDIFIFCCFTGLAYADVEKLNENDITIGIDGEKWIKTKRKKTNSKSNIPILPIAAMILDKYSDYIDNKGHNKLLPVLTNQKMNAYLKEIADLCGINKNFTPHMARHTFATTVTLSNGVPIESVSKMLGHSSLKTTQHYAKILDSKISNDMAILSKRLNL
ncbi:site-specific integrase [Joostella atrarenae]|uniref:Site-specific integrase n=1 Tax=Joostella atrarenae TaxID=679257 RepID=A0ABS9J7B3_9FLAO|nr:site-specific integrase [Joostella atrarenae]MCF8716316.1 site-specific integrase [Joostella atrarenae]